MRKLALLFAVFLAAATANATEAQMTAAKAAASAGTIAAEEAPVVIFNRTIFVFRAPLFGMSPATRAARAQNSINETLRHGGTHEVTIKTNPEGHLVMIGDALAFIVIAADVDPLRPETVEHAATSAAEKLRQVIAETLEARSIESLLKAATVSTIATTVFALLLWMLARTRRWLMVKLVSLRTHPAALKVGDTAIVERWQLVRILQKTLTVLRWLIVALLSYEWLSFVLSRFPYTRPWGERLNEYLLGIITNIASGILGALPGLGVAIVIFVIARFFVESLGGFLERMSRSESPLSWLGPDTMPTTRRLFNIAIWLFAIAMAYPYLPGAQTEAFKGISVLLGLMVSLGASSIVGQGAAGLILPYTRTMRPGEYVRVGEHEGTVMRIGMFTTTIRTGLGEELTLPNSVITGAVTKNYSRTVDGDGFIVDTTVTIGYDAPWRQVEAMLIEAAKRTPGIIDPPAPRVFQTALSDYYPEYRLVAQAIPSGPLARAEVLTRLHANIQDVFNEHGVQIMSPHYMMDPDMAKVVKPEDWHKAPAKKPDGEPGRGT
jgi:small-conductance mechanosensitive channel